MTAQTAAGITKTNDRVSTVVIKSPLVRARVCRTRADAKDERHSRSGSLEPLANLLAFTAISAITLPFSNSDTSLIMKKVLLLNLCLAYLAAIASAQKPTVTVETFLPASGSVPVPEYPAEALGKGFNGPVAMAITVNEKGDVVAAKVTGGPASTCEGVTDPTILAFRRVATESAVKTKFAPPVINGGAASLTGWIRYDFESNLKESPNLPGLVTVGGSDDAKSGSVGTQGSGPPKSHIAVLNGKAISLPKPAYPPAARAVRATGGVSVQVIIDEAGSMFSATAVSGHPLLRSASEIAACGAKFSPTLLNGKPVWVSGIITYNFVP
jgi:outer membrane biosynthesis protein TonB